MTRPHAVALFASSFAPHVGGVEELSRRLVLEQRREGLGSFVVTNRYPKTLPAHELIDGIPVYRERFRVPEPRVRHMGGFIVGTQKTRHAVNEALTANGADLVHVQCVSSNGYYALRAARRNRLPLVVSLQGELTMDANNAYASSPRLRAMWRSLITEATVVTGCSRQVIDEAVAAYGPGLEAKAHVVVNGVDISAVEAAQIEDRGRPYVLGIGRFVKQKGFDLLIDAFASIAADFPHIDLVLAGDGPELATLRTKADATPFRDRIAFLGPVPSSRAFALFRGATAFVLPSRHEPQGIVVIEAMSAGTPVVATRVGGVPETVRDGVNGLLVDAQSVPALARGLRFTLEDQQATRARVEVASRDVRNYAWSHIASRYTELYEVAMNEHFRLTGGLPR